MKLRFTAIILSVCLALAGCTSAEPPATAPETDQAALANTSEAQPSATAQDEPAIDVDLTALSSTMVYAEVYCMVMGPEDYLGKTVKMHGQFFAYEAILDDGTVDPDQIVYACVIADATACCAQGIEFVWIGEHRYPDDYPEPGSEITVIGEFQTYEAYGSTYCVLIDAELSF